MTKILPTRSSLPPFEEYVNEIAPLWESFWLTNMGQKHELLKSELKRFMNVDNLELFTNGHMSIELTLQVLGLKPGDEVITTPFTFASTTNAIVRCGLKPVFCDINDNDYTIDSNKIEKLITKKTKAILAVHVYGNICDIEKIDEIGKKYNLHVIFDSAHAFGESYKGKNIACYGDVNCFSFHATKVFHTIEGGCAVYKDSTLSSKYYSLKDFGLSPDDDLIHLAGTNAKMNEFCAAMGICNLRHLKDEIAKRKSNFELYISELEGIKGLTIPHQKTDVIYNYAYFPLYVDESLFGEDRNKLIKRLFEKNVVARKYFYPLTNETNFFETNNAKKETPVAYKVSRRIMTLPLYADLKYNEIKMICNIIKKK